MTISDQILETSLYGSGEPFGPIRMAMELGVTRQAADLALRYLVDQGKAERWERGLYCKTRPRHWIHTAPLNNADKLKDARALHAGRVLV